MISAEIRRRLYRNLLPAVRQAVFARDRGVCAKCGSTPKSRGYDAQWPISRTGCEIDHIKPRHLFPCLDEAEIDKCNSLRNLQTLCTHCHNDKTQQEITEAINRRKQAKVTHRFEHASPTFCQQYQRGNPLIHKGDA